jgi:hypothetical protein
MQSGILNRTQIEAAAQLTNDFHGADFFLRSHSR